MIYTLCRESNPLSLLVIPRVSLHKQTIHAYKNNVACIICNCQFKRVEVKIKNTKDEILLKSSIGLNLLQ